LHGSPRSLERKEAHPELDEPFDKAMIAAPTRLLRYFLCRNSQGSGRTPSAFSSLKAFE